MELKVVCQCGQKFKFDVEPVNGQMPFKVNCPVCNLDGTSTANVMLAEILSNQPPPTATTSPPPPPPVAAPAAAGSGLRLSRPTHTEPQPAAPEPASASTAPTRTSSLPLDMRKKAAAAASANPAKTPSFGMGLLGGLIGAVVGSIIYLLVFKYTGYQIKLLAIGVGALAGWLADFTGKGDGSRELGGIVVVFVLAGIVGSQYFVALGWWHEIEAKMLKTAQSAYANAVAESKEAIKAVPDGTDYEIRMYLAKRSDDEGLKIKPSEIPDGALKEFRKIQLPEYQQLASGKISKEQYEQQHEIKTSMTAAEKAEDDNTFKSVFLLLLLSKVNLFSLAAAAALSFKLCANA